MQYLLFFNLLKIRTFVAMTDRFVNIHTHRPTGRGIELRTAGIHPWNADKEDVSTIVPLLGDVQAVGETGLDFVHGADRETQLAAFRAQLALARERRFCTASGLSSRSCANWTPAGPAQRSSTASSDRPNRPAGPSEKVITSRSACVPSHRPKRWNPCAKRPSRSFFSKPTTATSRSRKSTRAPRK